MNDYTAILAQLDGLKVLVMGEAMLDSYLIGHSDRLCQEAAVPVVQISDRQHRAGGAANTAFNLKSLGGTPLFLSVTGADVEGKNLRYCLEQQGIATGSMLVCADRATLTKQRILVNHHLQLRLDYGSTAAIGPKTEKRLQFLLQKLWLDCQAVIISDYGYGLFTPSLITAIATLQNRFPRLIVADGKHLHRYQQVGLTAVKPNYREALDLLGLEPDPVEGPAGQNRIEALIPHSQTLLNLTGAAIVVVSLDREGCLICQRDRPPEHLRACTIPVACTVGAGDTFVSALTLGLAAGATLQTAAQLASTAAAIAISKPKTAACFASELQAWLEQQEDKTAELLPLGQSNL
uniref:PfkB domain protein n=1 Tax=Cyanothece sp. (strain PCC 7425 / ATCC 29141) TaxID=395961 RepID=B8HSR6_CYAP4